MSAPLSRLLLGAGPAGYGLAPITGIMGAFCIAWNPATYQNTITDGSSVVYQDCPVLAPSLMTPTLPFRVLIAVSPAGPIILGPLYKYVPPPSP